ncbi:HEPN family nuclease [Mesorhizobium sp. CC13]|uniref:HEPN family nuclease n=1 Tax=Mesorhizobium sp. CC13 TaxID=3029194 RepID=UPI0032632C63
MDIDRNTISGFARRVRKNLLFVMQAKERGADVHVVTELINSMLGLLIFPYEHLKRGGISQIDAIDLSELQRNGWPAWDFRIGSCENLGELCYHIRNSLSHRRVYFSGDERELKQVRVTFSDRPKNAPVDNWSVSISGADLFEFILRFSERVENST